MNGEGLLELRIGRLERVATGPRTRSKRLGAELSGGHGGYVRGQLALSAIDALAGGRDRSVALGGAYVKALELGTSDALYVAIEQRGGDRRGCRAAEA
jgi:hypothetical protein